MDIQAALTELDEEALAFEEMTEGHEFSRVWHQHDIDLRRALATAGRALVCEGHGEADAEIECSLARDALLLIAEIYHD